MKRIQLLAILLVIPSMAFSQGKRTLPSPNSLFDFAMRWMEEGHEAEPLIDLLEGNLPSPTPTATSTSTPTLSSTATPTDPPTVTPTLSETATETFTATPTPTETAQPFPTSGFVNFETPPVHPIEISPDGTTLALCNLADYRIEVYNLSSGTPEYIDSIPVGVDPVTVRFRTDTELWAVNHISDSISIIDLNARSVIRTLRTEDEPCDVVFAGTPEKAFVTCSQVNLIQVFDISNLEAPPLEIPIDAEDPRALALSPDGATVYAAIFESGNGSTLLAGGSDDPDVISFPPNVVENPLGPYGGVNPPPNAGANFDPPMNPSLPTPPKVGMIVKKNATGEWVDDNGEDWSAFVTGNLAGLSGRPQGWDLPDRDVAIIDVESATITGYATGMMNICMALSVNPGNGQVTVVGTDGENEVRFEPILNGKFLRVNLAIADPANPNPPNVVDLNPHLIPYTESATNPMQRGMSLGDPRAIVWNADGSKGYVAGMGSNNLAVIDSSGNRVGLAPTIRVGEGPAGLALDESRNRLYVLNRFDGSLSIIDTVTESEVDRIRYFDPTPQVIKVGRKHLYDTHKNSGLGQVACGSCHVDGRMDRLAWDLGDPSGEMKVLNPNIHNLGGTHFLLKLDFEDFHPMKGPMTTQTLQDIIGHEPLHWRGDRNGIEEFNPAFTGLQGAERMLSPQEMQEFEDFLATIAFPPNPNRNFDNSLPENLPLPDHLTTGRFGPGGMPMPNGNAKRGLQLYTDIERRLDQGNFSCVACHTLPAGMGTNWTLDNGLFGNPIEFPTGPLGEKHHALVSVDGSSNIAMKVPQLRNQFEKTGFNMFMKSNRAGFGYLHDGSVDTLERFLSEGAFDVETDQEVADLVALVLSFSGSDFGIEGAPNNNQNPPGTPGKDSHAAVGAQITIDSTEEEGFLDQMIAVTASGRVDLVVKGIVDSVPRGAVYNPSTGMFLTDINGEKSSLTELRLLASPSQPLTFTLVPEGTGIRVGVDRDGDGWGDTFERESGTNPNDSEDHP
ncbi:MAG: hypothetical protein KC944_15700 [Candidatus Omnitrophica bacterium]|nr:hypothetical protein [Candidatus Omnitrophota bacterium]